MDMRVYIYPVQKSKNTAVGIRHADHVALSISRIWHYLRQQAALGIVRSRCKALV
jgi:hypothetical protein